MCEISQRRLVPKATSADDGKFVSINALGKPVLVIVPGGGAAEASQANAENPATTNSTTYVSPRRLYNALTVFKDSEQTFSERITFTSAPRLTVGDGLILKTDDAGDIVGVSTLSIDEITDSATHVKMTTAERSKLSALSISYVGTYVDISALQTAHPVGQPGWEAILDLGFGETPKKAYWDESDTEWVEATGAGASTFAELGGSPGDNAALLAAFNAKQNTLGYTAENAANKNGINGYLGLNGTGQASADYIADSATRLLVSPAQVASWDGKQAALGYTAENAALKNAGSGYVGLDSGSNVKLGGATAPGRFVLRSDGTSPIFRAEDTGGTAHFTISNLGAVTVTRGAASGLLTLANNVATTVFEGSSYSILGSTANTISMYNNIANTRLAISGYITNGSHASVAITNNSALTATTGNQVTLLAGSVFAPTSGNAVYNEIEVRGTINQTGGANGATRGIFINPTITAAADFTAIQTNSKVRIGATSGNSMITVRGDGTNDIADLRNASGTSRFKLNDAGNITDVVTIQVAAAGYRIVDGVTSDVYAITVNDGVLDIEML